MVLVLTRFKGSALIFYLPGLRWAKGSSPDRSSQRQSEKLNISALILYLVHWVKTSGAIQRRFYKNNRVIDNKSCSLPKILTLMQILQK